MYVCVYAQMHLFPFIHDISICALEFGRAPSLSARAFEAGESLERIQSLVGRCNFRSFDSRSFFCSLLLRLGCCCCCFFRSPLLRSHRSCRNRSVCRFLFLLPSCHRPLPLPLGIPPAYADIAHVALALLELVHPAVEVGRLDKLRFQLVAARVKRFPQRRVSGVLVCQVDRARQRYHVQVLADALGACEKAIGLVHCGLVVQVS